MISTLVELNGEIMDQQKIKDYIVLLNDMTSFMNSLLDENVQLDKPKDDSLVEFTNLRYLCKSDAWPLAVPDNLICGETEDEKLARAYGIVSEFINDNVYEANLLDFGCGEGHVPYVAYNIFGCKKAVGYDIVPQWKTNDNENLIFTTDIEEVRANGLYDAIILNDVLDHSDSPEKIIEEVKKLKSHVGRIYVRIHPWTSRHASHLYKQLNKAYLHLVFTEDELYKMGLQPEKIYKQFDPVTYYQSLFINHGFKILRQETITQPVELFFSALNPVIGRRITEHLNKSVFPREILEIQFLDFVLS